MNYKKDNESRIPMWIFLLLGLLVGYGLTAQSVAAAPFAYLTNYGNNIPS